MYISTNIIEIKQTDASWIDRLYKNRENEGLEELLVINYNKSYVIFSVGLDPLSNNRSIENLLKSCVQKSNYYILSEITHLESFKYFITMLLGNSDPQSGDFEHLTLIKEDFNLALSRNAVGAVLTRAYRQGLDFANKILNRQPIKNSPVTEAQVITDIARKISEELDRFQFLLIGDNRERLEQLVQVLRGYSRNRIIMYSENFRNTYAVSIELGCVPVELSQIPGFLANDTLIVNTGRNDLKLWDVILPVIKENRNNLYLYFQYSSNSLPASLKKMTNLFIQTQRHMRDVINLHIEKRKSYFQEISGEIDREIKEFYDWLFSDNRFSFGYMVSQDRQMHNIFELIRRIAPTDVNVLINGETGTGKELVARAIHDNSKRMAGQFVAVNCSAIPESLLEGELFGYERGAFTGAVNMKKGLVETASGGTLFLDEIGDISPVIQVKLLRVLQEREIMRLGNSVPIKVDVRLVAATHKDLRQEMEKKSFRSDLYYRLNTVQIILPRLADRPKDIILLTRHFIDKMNRRLNKQVHTISEDSRQILLHYHWPGNVRELENVIERAVAVAIGETITRTDLPSHLQKDSAALTGDHTGHSERSLKDVEAAHIRDLLKQEDMNYSRVAEVLGISRTTLWRKMKEYGIAK